MRYEFGGHERSTGVERAARTSMARARDTCWHGGGSRTPRGACARASRVGPSASSWSTGRVDRLLECACRSDVRLRARRACRAAGGPHPQRFRKVHVAHRAAFANVEHARPMGAGLGELVGRRRDGAEFPVEVSLSPVPTSRGTFYAAAVRDATERLRIEWTLRDAEERFESRSTRPPSASPSWASTGASSGSTALSRPSSATRRRADGPQLPGHHPSRGRRRRRRGRPQARARGDPALPAREALRPERRRDCSRRPQRVRRAQQRRRATLLHHANRGRQRARPHRGRVAAQRGEPQPRATCRAPRELGQGPSHESRLALGRDVRDSTGSRLLRRGTTSQARCRSTSTWAIAIVSFGRSTA